MNLKPMLSVIEDLLVKEINLKQDAAVDKALALIAAKIPGQLDDVIIAQISAQVKDELKQLSLSLADKIDGEVG